MQSITFPVRDYDLAATLTSGQAFRWQQLDSAWTGVIGQKWVSLRPGTDAITVSTADAVSDWSWLSHYLQLELDLNSVLLTFPDDEPMQSAVTACRGLRLLRQDPWECLASFILSSTKQIVQIQQIVSLLCRRYGQHVQVPNGCEPMFSFPSAESLAKLSEAELRDCKMGFRAPYLLAAARSVASGDSNLERLRDLSHPGARQELMKLPGVGPKIADCVLLFAYGMHSSFPVDVWVMKALRQLYFPRRRVKPRRLREFVSTYFGPHAGYAQQYLFHYIRVKQQEPGSSRGLPRRSVAKAGNEDFSSFRSPHSALRISHGP